MFPSNQYQLLDFGEGRKLERFGAYLLDRPAVGTDHLPRERDDGQWRNAAKYARNNGGTGNWKYRYPLPSTWEVEHGKLVFEIKPTEFGHVGLFAEQAENWDWLAAKIAAMPAPPKLLNLFAYTGGSTLTAAAAGAQVVHVDAAANTVAWARQNAGLSGLTESPIRWIVEDAELFVRREVKRGNRYDGVILDPPSYGHGPKGEVWKIDDHLPPLLSLLAELTDGNPQLLLVTCHSPGYTPQTLRQLVATAFDRELARQSTADTMTVTAEDGRSLPCGSRLRWA